MKDIDRQIDAAKQRPLTADNLNTIGDLFLKRGDKQKAVAYFFESADKLHYAQKEKKMATYKKILNISPSSEKAYMGIIGILAKMGLVMEEKKYLHMLAELYESRGDSAKAEDLIERIREIDPHIIRDGTFFHDVVRQEVFSGPTEKMTEENVPESGGETLQDYRDISAPVSSFSEDKLVEATLEEIPLNNFEGRIRLSSVQLRYLYISLGCLLLLLITGLLFYFFAGKHKKRANVRYGMPVSSYVNNFEISLARLEDVSELNDIPGSGEIMDADFYVLTVSNHITCIPLAFATSPYDMISLSGSDGEIYAVRWGSVLQRTTRYIAKMNVCGLDNGVVFMRTVIALDRNQQYSGLSIRGLQADAPLKISWNTQ